MLSSCTLGGIEEIHQTNVRFGLNRCRQPLNEVLPRPALSAGRRHCKTPNDASLATPWLAAWPSTSPLPPSSSCLMLRNGNSLKTGRRQESSWVRKNRRGPSRPIEIHAAGRPQRRGILVVGLLRVLLSGKTLPHLVLIALLSAVFQVLATTGSDVASALGFLSLSGGYLLTGLMVECWSCSAMDSAAGRDSTTNIRPPQRPHPFVPNLRVSLGDGAVVFAVLLALVGPQGVFSATFGCPSAGVVLLFCDLGRCPRSGLWSLACFACGLKPPGR